MPGCAILNSRKRVIVALVHTVVFLLVAAVQVRSGVPKSAVLTAIYAIVTIVLAVLTIKAGGTRERMYFACCMTSAGLGLARQFAGDPPLHAAVYWRVALLGTAAIIGVSMLRQTRAPSRISG
jgi:hypothetical protein